MLGKFGKKCDLPEPKGMILFNAGVIIRAII
jgi:hypothetical protein